MIRSLKKIFAFSGKRQGTLIRSLILTLLKNCFGVLQICGVMVLLDAVMHEIPLKTTLIRLTVITVVCMVGSFAISYTEQVAMLSTSFGMVEDKRLSIGNLLKRVPLGLFSGSRSETIQATLTSTLASAELAAAYSISGVIGGFLSAAATLLMLIFYEWHIAVITLLCMVVYFGVINWQMQISKKHSHVQREAMNKLIASAITFIQGIKVTKAFSFRDGDKNIRADIAASSEANRWLTDVTMPSQFAGNLCIAVFETAILAADLVLYLQTGSIPPDKAIVLLIISFFVFSSMNQAGINLAMIGLLESAIDEVNELESTEQLEVLTPMKQPQGQEITFEDVCFSYDDHEVLHHINLKIRPQTITAVIGPSGSGKTTLCQLIARFWDVDSGVIRLGGADIRQIDDAELMKQISMVFQKVYLFEDTIENNIRMGKPGATHEEVVAAAKAASCDDFISALPEGYNTKISEGGGSLSGGEKQRISIARAILKDAPIIILDEATAALDVENEKAVMEAIDRLTKSKTVIMIAHRMKTVRNADQIIAVENGSVVQQGTHEELICTDGLYRRFVTNREQAGAWKIR